MDFRSYQHTAALLRDAEGNQAYRALLQCFPEGVLSHLSAGLLWGLDVLGQQGHPSQLIVPPGSRRRPCRCCSPQLSRAHLGDEDRVDFPGLAVTSPRRTVLDAARQLGLQEAVALADSALRLRLVTKAELIEGGRSLAGARGARHVRTVLALIDPLCGSCLESWLRVDFALAGAPAPETQVVLFGPDGERLMRSDFLWRAQRVVGEADGRATHDEPQQFIRDRHVQNVLAGMNYMTVRWTWAETRRGAGYAGQQVLRVLAARSSAAA